MQEPHPAQPTPSFSDQALPGSVILIVDDHEQNLELMQAFLEELGCSTQTARDGQEALDRVAEQIPDLIILDVMMPRMSGFQVCERLKGDPRTREVPIVMVTALNEVSDIERAVEAGADDFLTKPVHRIELLTRVRSLVRVGQLRRELDAKLRELGQVQDRGVPGSGR